MLSCNYDATLKWLLAHCGMPSVARRATLCFVPTSSTYPMWSKVVSPLGFHWNKHKSFSLVVLYATEAVKLNERQSQTYIRKDGFVWLTFLVLFFFLFYGMKLWYKLKSSLLAIDVTYCFWHLKGIFELPLKIVQSFQAWNVTT
jgi:hypothetical protein